jgi:hypothetical protein
VQRKRSGKMTAPTPTPCSEDGMLGSGGVALQKPNRWRRPEPKSSDLRTKVTSSGGEAKAADRAQGPWPLLLPVRGRQR